MGDDQSSFLVPYRRHGPDGKVTEWMIEGGSPNVLIRAGVTKNTVKVGTELTIEAEDIVAFPRQVGRNFVLPDGSRLFLGVSGPDSSK